MAFFCIFIKAIKLKHKLEEYKDEREISQDERRRFVLKNKKQSSWHRKLFSRLRLPPDSKLHVFQTKLLTPGTTEHFLLKSAFGFLCGILLTYFFFLFFVLGINFTLESATYISCCLAFFLSLGLAFSVNIRCTVLLLLPQLFSKQGRQALISYAFILALTGPARNTLNNMGVLSDSLACGQEQLKRTLEELNELVKQPVVAAGRVIKEIKTSVQQVVDDVRDTVSSIHRMALAIASVVQNAVSWLGSVVSFCNKKLGTPFDRCVKVFDDAVIDCKAKMGFMDFLCYIVNIVQPLCYVVKFLDLICVFTDFVSDSVVGVVRRRLREFSRHLHTMFYVDVEVHHSFQWSSNQSQTLQHIAASITKDIKDRTDHILSFFDVMSFVFSLFFLFILVKVVVYRHKFLTVDSFDNVYINQHLVNIDMRRARMDKDTILPLEPKEAQNYIKVTSLRLVGSEKKKLFKSFVLLSVATFKICIYLLSDVSLFWILATIRQHGRIQTEPDISTVDFQVQGTGYLANMYRSLIGGLKPGSVKPDIDSVPCLPDPVPPDSARYVQIGLLTALCWLLSFTEPYGLRARHLIMSYYHPDRATVRAGWLYNHILRTRGSFLKFARRQLKRNLKDGKNTAVEKVTLKQRLLESFPLLGRLFGVARSEVCLLCGQSDPSGGLIKCTSPNCVAKYCTDCFRSLRSLCTVCLSPVQYGDLSDVSEEKDSSDEEVEGASDLTSIGVGSDLTSVEPESVFSWTDAEENEYYSP